MMRRWLLFSVAVLSLLGWPGTARSQEDSGFNRGRICTVGFLEPEIADNLAAYVDVSPLPRLSLPDTPLVLSAGELPSLDEVTRTQMTEVYRRGQPIILLHPNAAEARRFLGMLQIRRRFDLPDGVDRVQAVVVDLDPDDALATFYGTNDNFDDQGNLIPSGKAGNPMEVDGAEILGWTLERSRNRDIQPKNNPQQDLTKLYNAWRDVAFFSDESGYFQVTTLLWGAHSLETKDDYYYVMQLCAFNPERGFKMRSGYQYGPKPFTRVQWDGGQSERFCQSDGGACEYKGYVTNYQIFMTPAKGTDLVHFLKASPETEVSRETWSTGVSWSLGGKFVAGLKCGEKCEANVGVEVNAGLTVSNSRQITVSDVTVRNRSLANGPNQAGWAYSMPVAHGVNNGFCQRGLSRPKNAQIYAFQPENHAIWVSRPALRHHAEGLELALELTRSYADSEMIAIGPPAFYLKTYCNVFDCNCEPETAHRHVVNHHLLTLPFPNTAAKP